MRHRVAQSRPNYQTPFSFASRAPTAAPPPADTSQAIPSRSRATIELPRSQSSPHSIAPDLAPPAVRTRLSRFSAPVAAPLRAASAPATRAPPAPPAASRSRLSPGRSLPPPDRVAPCPFQPHRSSLPRKPRRSPPTPHPAAPAILLSPESGTARPPA